MDCCPEMRLQQLDDAEKQVTPSLHIPLYKVWKQEGVLEVNF